MAIYSLGHEAGYGLPLLAPQTTWESFNECLEEAWEEAAIRPGIKVFIFEYIEGMPDVILITEIVAYPKDR